MWITSTQIGGTILGWAIFSEVANWTATGSFLRPFIMHPLICLMFAIAGTSFILMDVVGKREMHDRENNDNMP